MRNHESLKCYFCVIVLKGYVYRSTCFNWAIGLQSHSRTTDCILSEDQVVRNMVRMAGKTHTIIKLRRAGTTFGRTLPWDKSHVLAFSEIILYKNQCCKQDKLLHDRLITSPMQCSAQYTVTCYSCTFL